MSKHRDGLCCYRRPLHAGPKYRRPPPAIFAESAMVTSGEQLIRSRLGSDFQRTLTFYDEEPVVLIECCGANPEHSDPYCRIEIQMAMAFHGGQQFRKDCLQSFAADAIRRLSHYSQSFLDRLIIYSTTAKRPICKRRVLAIAWLAEQTNPMFTMVARQSHKLIEYSCLVHLRRIMVPSPHRLKQFLPCLGTDSLAHRTPPAFGNILMRQRPDFGSKKREST